MPKVFKIPPKTFGRSFCRRVMPKLLPKQPSFQHCIKGFPRLREWIKDVLTMYSGILSEYFGRSLSEPRTHYIFTQNHYCLLTRSISGPKLLRAATEIGHEEMARYLFSSPLPLRDEAGEDGANSLVIAMGRLDHELVRLLAKPELQGGNSTKDIFA